MNKGGWDFRDIPEIGVDPYSGFEDVVKHNLKVIRKAMVKDLETVDGIVDSFEGLSKDINGSGHTIDIEQLKKVYAVSSQIEVLDWAFTLMQRNLDALEGVFTGETRIEVRK